MRKMGVRLALLGAFAGMALLAGCNDGGRSWSLSSQEANYPHERETHVRLRRGANVGFPGHIPLRPGDSPAPGTGGSGFAAPTKTQLQATDAEREKLWLK